MAANGVTHSLTRTILMNIEQLMAVAMHAEDSVTALGRPKLANKIHYENLLAKVGTILEKMSEAEADSLVKMHEVNREMAKRELMGFATPQDKEDSATLRQAFADLRKKGREIRKLHKSVLRKLDRIGSMSTHRGRHPYIRFLSINKLSSVKGAALWKTLSPEERAQYEDQAKESQKAFRTEIESKKMKPNDLGKFVQMNLPRVREQILASNSDLPPIEINKLCFKALSLEWNRNKVDDTLMLEVQE
eukprot:TRINITY_DN42809_c0_g1_i1.p1 TRINITY_DN42809_c0_g1~~TRINITY_DN42809_c0_g1_i1.p1  ORF type:complete len:265 (+),score=72.98 TRINITY_DN42809_c0_g1_i1:55-795(+)